MADDAEAQVNTYGDVTCPHCGAHHITPTGAVVVAGTAGCQICRQPFTVSEALDRKSVV